MADLQERIMVETDPDLGEIFDQESFWQDE
jgi:hypothetical protein